MTNGDLAPATAIKVSVVVPVYNPGAHFEPCLRSLLGQSMPVSEHELIFVDDGSTDGTGERLDALAAEHPHVRVRHIPNSGWPGRPRNVGIEMARGEFVYFVDNDDWLDPEALERLYATAVADDADVVMGKVVGHEGKGVPRGVFRRDLHDATALTVPLGLLTPHKLFRRSLLVEHGIRFPEGRRRLEDHLMVMPAYFRARRISVLASRPCYHWTYVPDESNASLQRFDAVHYFDAVREVLDVVDAHTEPGATRDRLYRHWYRGKTLGRIAGPAYSRHGPAVQRDRAEEVRQIQRERFPPRLDAGLPYPHRLRAHLVREGTDEHLAALAELEVDLRVRAEVLEVQRDGDGLVVTIGGRLTSRTDGPGLRFVRDGDRVMWSPPAALREALDGELLDATAAFERSRIDVALISVEDGTDYLLPAETTAALDGGPAWPELRARAPVSPATAAAGAPLPTGRWMLEAAVHVAGFTAGGVVAPVRRHGEPVILEPAPGGGVRVQRLLPRARARATARRIPGLQTLIRRARELGPGEPATG